MRKPAKLRNIALAVTGLGVAALGLFAYLRIRPEQSVLFGLAIAACFSVILGTMGVVTYGVANRRLQRLLLGERLLARWTLSAAEWAQFQVGQAARADGTKNSITVRANHDAAHPANGIPVVITEEALMVDDDFYHLSELRGLTWHDTEPPHLQFRMVTQTRSGGHTYYLRVPTPQSETAAARSVWDYYQTRLAPPPLGQRVRHMRLLRIVCLVLVLIGTLGAILVRFSAELGLEPFKLASLMVAVLTLPGGLVGSAATHWWLTRGSGKNVPNG